MEKAGRARAQPGRRPAPHAGAGADSLSQRGELSRQLWAADELSGDHRDSRCDPRPGQYRPRFYGLGKRAPV
jgi:hypothetical protein